MLDVVDALRKVLNRSAKNDMINWIGSFSKNADWYVISDYVFDNPERHDTASFVVLLKHDKLETTLDYINNQAPKDIKKSRSPSEGLIKYLNAPVAFSFTFILDEGDNFFSSYAPKEAMIGGLEDLKNVALSMHSNTSPDNVYFSEVSQRINTFIHELKNKGNEKLARQVFLVSAYAAVVLDYLDISAAPSQIAWISDRDALLQRHNGIMWDLAAIMFYLLKGERVASLGNNRIIDKPKLIHVKPEERGKNYLDPLIRMPDYLAAAASSMNLHTATFPTNKLETIGIQCFGRSQNNILCSLSWSGKGFLVRRLSIDC